MAEEPSENNTYFLDSENPAEMARLMHLDRITTGAMGGTLVGVPDPGRLHTMLDLCCGPGNWVLDVAFEYPEIEVAGVDISKSMIDFANTRARTQQRTNASFEVMNITEPLDFSDNSFDLINARFLVGVLHKEVWPSLIAECTRLLRPGGFLRLTEMVDSGASTSPAFERMNAMLYEALWRVGYGFSPDGRTLGITPILPRLLRNAGYQSVQHFAHALEFSTNTEGWSDFYRNMEIAYKLVQPFFLKAGVTTQDEIDRVYQQALIEMLSDDLCGIWHYTTFVGVKP